MASKIPQLKSKVSQAASYYKLILEQNKHYIQDPPTVEKCQSLAKQLFYTRLASIPVRIDSFWKELEYLKNLKNREALNMEYFRALPALLLCLDLSVLLCFVGVRLLEEVLHSLATMF